MAQAGNDFNAIRISLASPDQIKTWSYGEVTKPETINYRTLRPEKDGLFCERIFGPTKDWECYCGKYKKIRYKGVICDRCGVEVARSKVRRERMGRITLAAPVAHIWFSKGTPSRLGLLLDLSPRNLERVIYFAQYLVTNVNEDLRKYNIDRIQKELDSQIEQIETEGELKIDEIQEQIDSGAGATGGSTAALQAKIAKLKAQRDQDLEKVEEDLSTQLDELEALKVGMLLTETKFRELRDKYAEIFVASMGAEAVLEVLKKTDLDKKRLELQEEIRTTSGQRRKKAIKTLRVTEAFRKSTNKPEWMIMTVLPVLPPELRPMVQLDGGRFATSDLNDLYRRVINRNNRLKRLIELQAPEIIIRNEKRMLQEAVDALIDNGRRGRAVSGSHNHKLKSLSDLLRGKQGRFRQNLLGKRVDYSGRSVITVGPTLKLNNCGLPRRMALELFKPFVMNKLVLNGYAHNIKSAKRMAERARPEVWDILEEVVKKRPVLLNRAPTLHRLGIQAFNPILVDGGAIQVHPLVCTAFNADFDGDQMAVHVPLSKGAVAEAKKVMLSTYNMLSPSSGEPIVSPTLDMVLGCYYMTMDNKNAKGAGRSFSSFDDARMAYEMGQVELRAPIKVRDMYLDGTVSNAGNTGQTIETTVGRIIFNSVLPPGVAFRNEELNKAKLKEITAECYRLLGNDGTADFLDAIKDMGFKFASKSGTTIGFNDIEVSPEKAKTIGEAENQVNQLEQQYLDGLITEQERYENTVQIWTQANERLTNHIKENLRNYRGIYLMATSGAKGNIAQIKQMAGMRGLMSDPKGRIIDRPIKSNFREGLTVLEYFISTHGARKGLADTALRTADSGYLTRRLIDVAQEVIVVGGDCGTQNWIWIENAADAALQAPFDERIRSRFTSEPIVHPETGEIIVDKDGLINEATSKMLKKLKIPGVAVRSPLICELPRGICPKCYGLSLATWKEVMLGEAVGIIAAQSIGEPGTQLTMRTFHTGGIAGADITSGLPRVEELFEARAPKGEAVLSEIDGVVEVNASGEGRTIKVISMEEYRDEYPLPEGYRVLVSDGDQVTVGQPIAAVPETKGKGKDKDKDKEPDASLQAQPVTARVAGTVTIADGTASITWSDEEQREYVIPAASHIVVKTGEQVTAGQALTNGPKAPQQILRIQGREPVQRYLIEEVQKVYRSQGVSIHDKHIEVVISQMLRKVRIDSPGDTDLLPGELVDRHSFDDINAGVLAEGGEPATASPVLLGITRASLNMESFLAAASFQETTRVLTESAINGDIDYLRGLKENVIIGRLIPARFDMSPEGIERLGLNVPEEKEPVAIAAPIAAEAIELQPEVFDMDEAKDLVALAEAE
ncbi:MAG: DNA-directed RNA polymerase subunit beta' [SAR202 cluster bacterium]|nr:DNA-directed RNA polymerase subunit beta' [SAR202 cluster bacterium]